MAIHYRDLSLHGGLMLEGFLVYLALCLEADLGSGTGTPEELTTSSLIEC